MNTLRTAVTSALAVIAIGSAVAQPATSSESGSKQSATVFTRARVASFLQETDNRFYVRLKLLPSAKLPFMTQAFRVTDRSLLADIPEGAWVKFTSRRVDGENVLTAIHVVDECKRFQPCD
ncbi:copper-binding protein [Variovorax rhizosphaerae]|uniref:Copper-binding protein n=1 Tax=Variovorax rhizosphaerae TaxID=1836200 RepID=A0ABU8WLY0_9BURK